LFLQTCDDPGIHHLAHNVWRQQPRALLRNASGHECDGSECRTTPPPSFRCMTGTRKHGFAHKRHRYLMAGFTPIPRRRFFCTATSTTPAGRRAVKDRGDASSSFLPAYVVERHRHQHVLRGRWEGCVCVPGSSEHLFAPFRRLSCLVVDSSRAESAKREENPLTQVKAERHITDVTRDVEQEVIVHVSIITPDWQLPCIAPSSMHATTKAVGKETGSRVRQSFYLPHHATPYRSCALRDLL
jgi:hypothetical protein